MSRTPPCPSFRTRTLFALIAAALLLPSGCSDDPVEPPSVENFARSWSLTSCAYRSNANPALSADLVGSGWAINLFVNDNGRLRYAWTPPGGEPDFWDGSWSVDGGALVVTRDGFGFSWEFEARVQEASMTMSGAQAEYDFDNDGTPEAATWNLAGTTE